MIINHGMTYCIHPCRSGFIKKSQTPYPMHTYMSMYTCFDEQANKHIDRQINRHPTWTDGNAIHLYKDRQCTMQHHNENVHK